MSADILAIGPFSADIIDTLEYPDEFYAQTRPGVPVITYLFDYMPGSSTSREFATHLGITDPWDFNQHKIDALRVDLDALRGFLVGLHEPDVYLSDLEFFVRLREKHFDFYFRPNG
jgi:hypothetical protein